MNLGQSISLTIFSQKRADADNVETAAPGARLCENAVADVLLLTTKALPFYARIFAHEAFHELGNLVLLRRRGVRHGALLLGPFVQNLIQLIGG